MPDLNDLQTYLTALGKYRDKIIAATKNAEQQCTSVALVFYAEGSSSLILTWRENRPSLQKLDPERRGLERLAAEFIRGPENFTNSVIFDSLDELMAFFENEGLL